MEGSSDQLEIRILDSAARLIGHYGYDKTTIDEIARDAGVAKSTLYRRWKSKEALLNAVLWRETLRLMEDWLARVEADPKGDTFAGIFRAALLSMRDNAFIMALYSDNRRVIANLLARPELQDAYAERQRFVQYTLRRLQAVGAVRADVDVDLYSYMAVALQYGLLNLGRVIPDAQTPPLDHVIEMTADMISVYLEPPEGGNLEAGKAVIREIIEQARTRVEAIQERGLS